MSASGTVIVTMLLSFLLFVLAGDNVPAALAAVAPLQVKP